MTKLKTYTLFLSCIVFSSFMKMDDFNPLIIKTKIDFFSVDNIGNVFTVNGDELIKHSANGKFFARYSNLKLGNISSLDATNPLKLLLYYRDFQQIVFLDNQLSKNSNEVSLETLGYEQTDLACAGANNSFWIYDKQNNELIRFNENSKKICSTGNLKQILRTDLSPNFMKEHNGNLFLNCPETGVFVFDIFGGFIKIISLKDLKQFDVNESIIYYKKDSLLCSYNFKLFDEACKRIPNREALVKYQNKKLYSAYKDSMVIEDF